MPAYELTANLDAKRGQHAAQLLRQRVLEMDTAIVIVLHDHRIEEAADRVFWLQGGRL